MSSQLLQPSYRFKRRDRISVDTCTLWQVRSGLVRTITWNQEGDVVPLGLWSPGSIIGVPISQVEPCELQCLSTVELERLPLDYALTVDMLLKHTAQVNRLLQIMHCRQVQDRLLQFSCWLAENFGQPTSHGDRKSTRLNSSHLVISYAVFCLKKKNIQSNTHSHDMPTTLISRLPPNSTSIFSNVRAL